MRHAKVVAALALARDLAASADGLTLDEMAARLQSSRRTAERMRDAIEATFGPLDRLEDGRRVRFRLAAGGIGRFAMTPTAEEIAELRNVARFLQRHDPVRARTFETLAAKIGASLRDADRRRLAPDVECRLRTEVWAHGAGPKETCRPEVLAVIREALVADRVLDCLYRRVGSTTPVALRPIPYGMIFGRRHYLVAGFENNAKPHLLRLDRIDRADLTDTIARAPDGFEVGRFARRSFGIYQEEPRRIELLFRPDVAADARATVFHPDQSVETLEDGRVRVRFTAGGIEELKRYLDRWGAGVTLVEDTPGTPSAAAPEAHAPPADA